jgi:hypothetical protein
VLRTTLDVASGDGLYVIVHGRNVMALGTRRQAVRDLFETLKATSGLDPLFMAFAILDADDDDDDDDDDDGAGPSAGSGAGPSAGIKRRREA